MHRNDIPQWAIERGQAMRAHREIAPQKTAVVVIDLQNFFLTEGFPMANPFGLAILPNVNRLTAAYRKAGALIVFTQHSFANAAVSAQEAPELRQALSQQLLPGAKAFAFHPDLDVREEDMKLTKHTASALHPRSASGLLETLTTRGIEQIVVLGVVTNGCCETTARDAHQHGFQVAVVPDACATMTDAEHEAALLNLAILFAQVPMTGALLASLA